MTATTLPALLNSLLDSDPARPLVTFYDDATGERIELSVKSFENWVAKTANLLQDELSADPGEHVALWLPAHWQSAVWMFAAAACGVVVSHDPGTETPVDIVVCGPDSLVAATESGARERVALSLRPMGHAFDEALPEGTTDYAGTVLAQDDSFLPIGTPDGDAPFALAPAGSRSQRELLEEGRGGAESLGLPPAGRLLTDANPADPAQFTKGVLAALVSGGSVVLNRHPDPAAVDGRVTQEQVTVQWWAGR
ncbi:MAG TPA: TIGR03089 family protein [Nocardioidaceae bacterium]|nr:TIGR03089 family protein [Nocardioidaceae bacterium]